MRLRSAITYMNIDGNGAAQLSDPAAADAVDRATTGKM